MLELGLMFEYRVVKVAGGLIGRANEGMLEEQLNDLAAEGWRLVETTVMEGTTVAVVVEREAIDGEP